MSFSLKILFSGRRLFFLAVLFISLIVFWRFDSFANNFQLNSMSPTGFASKPLLYGQSFSKSAETEKKNQESLNQKKNLVPKWTGYSGIKNFSIQGNRHLDDEEFVRVWKSVQEERLHTVEKFCKEHQSFYRRTIASGDISWDGKDHIVYCRTAKAGTTTVLSSLLAWNEIGRWKGMDSPPAIHTKAFKDFGHPSPNMLLQDNIMFVVSRHPFIRLVSAYRNKFARGYLPPMKNLMIINAYRNASEDLSRWDRVNEKFGWSYDTHPTFREFVLCAADSILSHENWHAMREAEVESHQLDKRNSDISARQDFKGTRSSSITEGSWQSRKETTLSYLLPDEVKRENPICNLDIHFQPVYDRCSPCFLTFDIIGKTKTLSEDIRYLKILSERLKKSDKSGNRTTSFKLSSPFSDAKFSKKKLSLMNVFRQQFSPLKVGQHLGVNSPKLSSSAARDSADKPELYRMNKTVKRFAERKPRHLDTHSKGGDAQMRPHSNKPPNTLNTAAEYQSDRRSDEYKSKELGPNVSNRSDARMKSKSSDFEINRNLNRSSRKERTATKRKKREDKSRSFSIYNKSKGTSTDQIASELLNMLTEEERDLVYEAYRYDFELFGYSPWDY